MRPFFPHILFATFISTTLEAYQLPRFRPLHIKYPLSQEEPQELLKRIQNHQIAEIRVADDLKSVISIPNPLPPSADPLFEQSQTVFDNTNLRNTNLDVNQNGDTYHTTKINSFLLPKIIDTSLENSVQTTFLQESFVSHFLHNPFGTLYENAFPLLLIGVILQRLFQFQLQQFRGGGNIFPGAGNRGNGRNPFLGFDDTPDPLILSNTKNTSLSDWAGSPEIFYECYEIISYLQNKTEFQAVGAEIPRGILLEGPPGTGKTLLARAIASEVNASFISVVGSQFVEMFVGVGALRIRELFEAARENRPCVLFIDEIDAIGKKRGGGASGFSGNDEREQTLNQLLAEMDGFQDNEGILVIAATNLKDTLDKALTRPGRFDRILSVPLPDTPSREKILHKYLDSKPVDTSSLSIEELAELTAGFSGADLKNLVNEALIHMIRRRNLEKSFPPYSSNFFSNHVAVYMSDNYIDKPSVAILKQEDVNQALEKILIGIVKQNDTRSIEIQRRVALHELGHAVMVATHSDDFDLQKISIQNTYSGIGGFTLFRPKWEITEGGLYTKEFLEKRLQIMLGGRAAEEVFYGTKYVSLGATRDLEEANSLAKQMVEQYGMGSNETNVYFRVRDDSNFGGGIGGVMDTLSENTKSKLEKESYDLVACAYQKTLEQIRHYEIKLEKLSLVLLIERVFYGNPFC